MCPFRSLVKQNKKEPVAFRKDSQTPGKGLGTELAIQDFAIQDFAIKYVFAIHRLQFIRYYYGYTRSHMAQAIRPKDSIVPG